MAIISDSGTWAIGSNWPWPRFVITDYYLLGFAIDGTNLKLYELVSDGSDYNATELLTLGALSGIDQVSVAYAERHYVVSASGYNDSDELSVSMWGRWPRAVSGPDAMVEISSGYIPYGAAVCYYKGQLIVGGLKTSDVKWAELGRCAVAYGGIGNSIFDPEQDVSAGFDKMPWDRNGTGKVYQIKQLGDDVIVYGNNGIERMSPISNEIITGFGHRTIQLGGILAHECVAGDDKKQCFIDNDHNLCLLTDGIKVLGYKKFMQNLTAANIIMNYVPLTDYFYISDGTYCYVLTPAGLYQTHQCVTSVGFIGQNLLGFTKNGTDTKVRLTTTGAGFKTSGLKTINSLEYDVEYSTSTNEKLYGRAQVKYTPRDEYVPLPWVELNNEGVAYHHATGRLLKFSLEAEYKSDGEFSLNSAKANVNFSDARTRRGVSDTTN